MSTSISRHASRNMILPPSERIATIATKDKLVFRSVDVCRLRELWSSFDEILCKVRRGQARSVGFLWLSGFLLILESLFRILYSGVGSGVHRVQVHLKMSNHVFSAARKLRMCFSMASIYHNKTTFAATKGTFWALTASKMHSQTP